MTAAQRARRQARIRDLADGKTTAELQALRDAAWARVCRATSTRWDLTRFEDLDDALRLRRSTGDPE